MATPPDELANLEAQLRELSEADLSHAVRNSLNVIVSAARLLRAIATDDKQRDFSDKIVKHSFVLKLQLDEVLSRLR